MKSGRIGATTAMKSRLRLARRWAAVEIDHDVDLWPDGGAQILHHARHMVDVGGRGGIMAIGQGHDLDRVVAGGHDALRPFDKAF